MLLSLPAHSKLLDWLEPVKVNPDINRRYPKSTFFDQVTMQ